MKPPARSVTRAVSHRRLMALLGVALAVVLSMLALGVVPDSGSAVVAVSRFGDGARLLPHGITLSLLALERRLSVPREGDAAVLTVPTTVHLPGGLSAPARALRFSHLPVATPSSLRRLYYSRHNMESALYLLPESNRNHFADFVSLVWLLPL